MSGFFQGYSNFIKARPLLGNGITTAVLFGTGDALAQILFPEEVKDINGNGNDLSNGKKKIINYDFMRTFRGMIYGGLIFAPIGSKWYKYLDTINIFKKSNSNFLKKFENDKIKLGLNTIVRVSVDQLIWAPVGIPLYFSCMTLMEGGNYTDLKLNLKENWYNTLITNWKVWPIFQLFNFYLTPVQHRLVAVNLISILWNCFLSYRNSLVSKEIEKSETHFPPIPE